MSNQTFKNYIKSIVQEEITLLEKLRGTFDWNTFKSLSSLDEMEQYCLKTLGKPLGKGSSRIVFALSSNKVLKLAKNISGGDKGRAQNKLEVETFTNPKAKAVVAKIYDYDPAYNWIISEITRPFKSSIKPEQAIGIDSDTFEEILRYSLMGKTQSFDQTMRHLTGKAEEDLKNIKRDEEALRAEQELLDSGFFDYEGETELRLHKTQIKNKEKDLGWRTFEVEKLLAKFSKMNVSRLKPLIDGLIAMRDEINLDVNDIMRMDHYGLTADGRIVLIDYGYDLEVGRKFYGYRG